jgi:hypothetical protein
LHGYTRNPFDDIVERTFRDTRSEWNKFTEIGSTFQYNFPLVYLILGHYHEHIGLLESLQKKELLHKGNLYFNLKFSRSSNNFEFKVNILWSAWILSSMIPSHPSNIYTDCCRMNQISM